MTSRKERTTSGIAGNKFCLRNIANATAKALAHLLAYWLALSLTQWLRAGN